MRLSKSWIIATKDFKVFFKKKNIIYSIVILPTLISVLFPAVIEFVLQRNGAKAVSVSVLTTLLPAFAFFWLILAGVIPTTLASYSIVGEKVEKSLEPLLATPMTDSEILLGKGISSFLIPMAAILGGSTIFMGLMDLVTYAALGYNFFPNWGTGIILFLMVPLATVMSVEWNVIVSSRVSDVRVAQQIGFLLVLPFGGMYVAGELGLIQLGVASDLLVIAGVMLVVDAILLYVSKATFRREEILTKWK